ncbi:MAG: hypothetical protein CMP39_04170 [Rickettsiales bacterium]|nr:hypothetical protein [Rickettsiales bacterium]
MEKNSLLLRVEALEVALKYLGKENELLTKKLDAVVTILEAVGNSTPNETILKMYPHWADRTGTHVRNVNWEVAQMVIEDKIETLKKRSKIC